MISVSTVALKIIFDALFCNIFSFVNEWGFVELQSGIAWSKCVCTKEQYYVRKALFGR